MKLRQSDNVVRYIPEWVPGAKFQSEAKSWKPYVSAMINEPYDYVRKQMVSVSPSAYHYITLSTFVRRREEPSRVRPLPCSKEW